MQNGQYLFQRMFCSEECKDDYHEEPFLAKVDVAVSKAQELLDRQLEEGRAQLRRTLDQEREEFKKERDLLYEAMCPADKRRFIGWVQKRKKT